MSGVTNRPAGPVDAAMLRLVRLVVDDAWTAATAASELRRVVPDQVVLRQLRARVFRSLTERYSPMGERAASILDLALSPRPSSGVSLTETDRV